jgi:hypothetical protein
MKNENNTWSEGLQRQTREAISEMRASPYDGKLHFKNYENRFAFINIQDLMCSKLYLTDKENGQLHDFVDVDALLDAGWVID